MEFRQVMLPGPASKPRTDRPVRRCGLQRCRYDEITKTHLQHLISAAAINLVPTQTG